MSDKETPAPSPADEKPKAEQTGAEPAKAEKLFTQAELEKAIEDRLNRATKAAETKAADERKKAEAEALAKQGEWQRLAEQRQADLDAASAKLAQSGELVALLNAQLDARFAAFPPEVKALDPGPGDVMARLRMADTAAGLASKLSATAPPGAGERPKMAGQSDKLSKEQEAAIRARFRI